MTCNGLYILFLFIYKYLYIIADHAHYFHQITYENYEILTFLTF